MIAISTVALTITTVKLAQLSKAEGRQTPRVEQGVLDLSSTDLAHGALIPMAGEWQFYWDRSLGSEDLDHSDAPRADYFTVPELWQGQVRHGTSVTGQGSATYRLQVKLPPSQRSIGIKIPEMRGYAKVYLNGELAAEYGSIDHADKVTVASGKGHYLSFVTNGPSLDIIIQMFNYSTANGGMKTAGLIGDTTAVFNSRSVDFGIDGCVISVLLFMFFYNFSLALIQRREKSNLWLSLFAVMALARVAVTGQVQLAQYISDLGDTWFWRIELITYYLSLPLLTEFINSLFPEETDRRYTWMTLALVIPFSILTLASQPGLFSPAKIVIQILQVILSIAYIRGIARAIRNKRAGAGLFLIGFATLATFSLAEVVAIYGMTDAPRLSTIGTIFFAVIQSILLARRYNNAFRSAEISEKKVRELHHEIVEQNRTRMELTRIETEKAMLKASMAEAQAFYNSLGDSRRTIPGLQVASHLQAAEVAGGDWLGIEYDRTNNVAYIAIADVTGHDMLSALVTVAAIGAFRGATAALKSQKRSSALSIPLAQILATMNEAVRDAGKKSERLMTMALVVVDLSTGESVYANAGHTPLLHARNGQIKAVISQNNPLGLAEQSDWNVASLQLASGDALFLYTDGLLDNEGPDGGKLKPRALRRILTDSKSPADAHRTIVTHCQTIWRDEPQKDDSSFVHLLWQNPANIITGDAG